MRVLMVTRETHEDRRYGLGKSLALVLEPMRGLGVEVGYFCQEDMPPDAAARRHSLLGKLARLPFMKGRAGRLNLAHAWLERLHVGTSAARLARAQGYTHIHAHDPWLACGVALELWMHGAGAKVRWGLTQHGFGSYSHATHEDGLVQGPGAQRWMRRVERAIMRRAQWVTAPTAASLAQLARDLGLAGIPDHWHRVPHARPQLEPADLDARRAARAALGWSDDDVAVLSVGRLVPLKCFDRVVSACAALNDPRVRLLLLGAGDATGLRALASGQGFDGRLQVAATHDIASFLHAADIYISASSTESFGLANLEALCAGLPAICSAVGGVPEVVADGAWLVTNDVETLTAALRALVADPHLRELWARRGLQRAAKWPTAQQIAENYVAIYQAA
jgi:glycosyltransferase involved in cell wall biosynthesis